jgi:hypothetical protein
VEEAIVCQLTTKGTKATKKKNKGEKLLLPLTNPGLPSCSFVSFVVEILWRYGLPNQLFQRAKESFILLRRTNAYAYRIGRAPWH